jgi:fermentation-respiration switch protein FrsA (DUF1100 family)
VTRIALAALIVAAGVAVLLALAWALQRRLIYFPLGDVPSAASVGLSDAQDVVLGTADGVSLRAWFIEAQRRGAERAPTVLVLNGNAGNRGYRAPLASALRSRGFNVLLMDYRGFGGNAGTPSERGLALDSRAARAYLATRPDVDASRVVYFGESLGAAVAVELAVEHPPLALVLRSPFTSLADVGRYHYPALPVRALLRDRFDSLGRIGRVRAPLLVIAADRDSIVPVEQSRRLYDAAPGRKALVVVAGADHNDAVLLAGSQMLDAIERFVAAGRSG